MKTLQTAPSGSLPLLVRRWWRIIYRVEWDKRGHWIVSRKKDHAHHLWFMIGRCESDDGISIFQLVIGPLGIAVGLTPNEKLTDGGHKTL